MQLRWSLGELKHAIIPGSNFQLGILADCIEFSNQLVETVYQERIIDICGNFERALLAFCLLTIGTYD